MLRTPPRITAKEAVALIRSGDEIVTGLGASEAVAFLSVLHERAEELQEVQVTNCLPMHAFPFMEEAYQDSFAVNAWFYTPLIRHMHARGNASFIPNNLHFAATKRLAYKRPQYYVGACSAVDRHGYVSLSTSNTYERRMIDAADTVILETNPNYPRTLGDLQVHVSEIDYLIEADHEVPVLPEIAPTPKDEIIGGYIAELIHDGDCLQIGIGGIPNAVTNALMDKKDLGIHTEMMTTGIARLAKAGVITGAKKSLHKHKMVAAFVLGEKELYDFCDDHPGVMILDGHYVNHPGVIAQNAHQVSINTTLEIDLTGQCCSESIGARQYSGTGGQTDTARGAQDAEGGRSIIALYSTAMIRNKKTGEREPKSKIVASLTEGAIVSLSRNDVDIVVTEYGVVHLRGTTVKERVERLISIAHPDFRAGLLEDAKALGIIA